MGEPRPPGPLQRFAQVRSLFRQHLDHLVHVPVRGRPRDAVITRQRLGRGGFAEPPHPQHRLPKAGQRPAAPWSAAAAALCPQQLRHELHQFPRDVKRDTIGDHVEPSGEGDLVVRPLLPGLHAHVPPARFLRVSASTSSPGQDKARLSEPISLRSPQWPVAALADGSSEGSPTPHPNPRACFYRASAGQQNYHSALRRRPVRHNHQRVHIGGYLKSSVGNSW